MMSGKMFAYGVLFVLMASLVTGISTAQGSEGKIRADDVILIHNVWDLQNMSKNLSGHYALANDIDASITRNWNGGAGFMPIGDENTPFNGTFDGKGYKIINLWINRSSEDYVGLFGYTTENAMVENVGLLNVSVRGSYYVGGLVGENDGKVNNSYVSGSVRGFMGGGFIGFNYGTVDNSYAAGNVSGEYYAGGLVGYNMGIVNNSHATGNMSAHYAGGLVGTNDRYGTVNNSYAMGNVSGDYFVGGLIGRNYGTVNNSYSIGEVSGTGDDLGAGGLAGNNTGMIENSYATGNVSASGDDARVGGLVGYNYGTVNNSYAMGNVSGGSYEPFVGGLIGVNVGMVSNSYALSNVSASGCCLKAGGLIGQNFGMVKNSHYNVDKVLINGGHYVTRGGIFHGQFNDWLSNDKKLYISDYPSLSPNGDYYEIRDIQGLKDLLGFAEDNLKFRLMADINLSEESGLHIPYFVGVLDGNGHTISNLNVSVSFVQGVGLIGINIGTLENIMVVNTIVSGGYSIAGGLVGWNDGMVNNSYANGNVSGYYYVGGLVGWNNDTVNNSYATGNVSGYDAGGLIGENYGMVNNSYATGNVSGYDAGGLIGENYGTVNNSYAMGNVSGEYYAGGLVGANDGMVNNSYATGNVSGSNAGGLVGWNVGWHGGTVNNSYATGDVRGNTAGGLVGANSNGGIVSNSYSTGNVSATGDSSRACGLVGYGDGTVVASFWDVNTSGIDHSDGGTGLTTKEMKNKTTFLNAGWDFVNIWDIVDGQTYPFFKWQQPSRPSAPLYLTAMNGTGYVNLTWTNPSFDGALPITKYNIYRNGTKIAEVSATQLWYNDTHVVSGQTYVYYITAVNAVGEGPGSNKVEVTPGEAIPEMTTTTVMAAMVLALLFAIRRRR